MPFDQLEEHVEALRGRQIRVKLVVRFLGVFETAEYLRATLHVATVPRRLGVRTAAAGDAREAVTRAAELAAGRTR